MVKRPWVANVIIGTMGLMLVLAQVAGPAAWYYAGRTNRDQFEILFVDKLLLLLAAAAVCFGILIVVTIARLIQRRFRAAIYPACLLALAVLLVLRRSWWVSPDAYQSGLRVWMLQHVTPAVIENVRNWSGKLPPTTQARAEAFHLDDPVVPGEIPSRDWPTGVRSLSPDRVIQVRDGLILQWGTFGTWGSSRRLFVTTGTIDKVDDGTGLYDYEPLIPNAWFAVQVPG